MNRDECRVLILDDDLAVLASLERLLKVHGFDVQTYSTPAELLLVGPSQVPSCLLLDQHLGETKGTQVHAEMIRRGWNLPTVFLTADIDIHTVVKAMRGGADNYLAKPFDPEELINVVRDASERALQMFLERSEVSELRQRAILLTARERTIVSMVAKGMLNKQIAHELDLALVTVKLHRGRAMQKLGAQNAAELARIALKVGL